MKKNTTTATLATLITALYCSTALAETSLWTDTKGKTIEAEFVSVLNDQVLLRLADRREIRVSLDTLSAEDRREAMLKQPPALELKVSSNISRSNSSLRDAGRLSRIQVEEESTRVTVGVIKKSSAVYEEPLNAVLYILGERGGQPAVLDKTSATFVYAAGEKEFELTSNTIELQKPQGARGGTDYTGWLVTVLDSNGEIIALKSNKREYEENVSELLASAKEVSLDRGQETFKTKRELVSSRFTRF